VLRPAPDAGFGYVRDFEILPNTLPPERHLGYAVQWFALSAATAVIALLLTFRARRRARAF
jgi:cytochrome oxidase assembly protein ShyY1